MHDVIVFVKERLNSLVVDGRIRSLVSKSLLAFFVKICSAILSFAMFALLARAMGKESYGAFVAAFSLATFLAIAGSFGQGSLILRFAGLYGELNKKQLLNGLILNGYLFVCLGCLVLGSFGILWSALGRSGIPSADSIAVCVLALAIGLVEYQAVVMRVLAGIFLSLVPRDIVWRLIIIVVAILSVLAICTASTSAWLWFFAGSLFFVILCQFWWFANSNTARSLFSAVIYDRPTWFNAMVGLWLSAIVSRSIGSLSVVIVDGMLGPSEAAAFFAALRTAQLLNIFQIAIGVVCVPIISREIGNQNWRNVRMVSTFAAVASGGGAVVGWLFFYFFGAEVLEFFGPEFRGAQPVLLVVGLGYAISGLAGPAQALLQMGGHDRPFLLMLLISNGLGLCAMPFAILHWGVHGAALAVAIGVSGWNIFAWIYSRIVLKVDPSVFGVFPLLRQCRKL
jgi:O-antigen/teichoic acid export membrane protein